MTAVEIAPDEYARLEVVERGAAEVFLEQHAPGAGAPLAIVIPAYNEEPTVSEVIADIPGEVAGLATEVIVVVDGAKDATAARAAEAGALVCDVPVNRGQGAALRLGYWLARVRGAQAIITIDADCQCASSGSRPLITSKRSRFNPRAIVSRPLPARASRKIRRTMSAFRSIISNIPAARFSRSHAGQREVSGLTRARARLLFHVALRRADLCADSSFARIIETSDISNS